MSNSLSSKPIVFNLIFIRNNLGVINKNLKIINGFASVMQFCVSFVGGGELEKNEG